MKITDMIIECLPRSSRKKLVDSASIERDRLETTICHIERIHDEYYEYHTEIVRYGSELLDDKAKQELVVPPPSYDIFSYHSMTPVTYIANCKSIKESILRIDKQLKELRDRVEELRSIIGLYS